MAVVDMYGNLGPEGPGTKKKKAMKKTKYSNNTKSCKGHFNDKGKPSCKPKKNGVIKKDKPKNNKPTPTTPTTPTTTPKTAKGRIGTPWSKKKKEEIVEPVYTQKSKNPRFL